MRELEHQLAQTTPSNPQTITRKTGPYSEPWKRSHGDADIHHQAKTSPGNHSHATMPHHRQQRNPRRQIEPIQQPRQHRQRQQPQVEVGHPLHPQACARQGMAQALRGIAPLVLQEFVVRAPHPPVRRHRDQHASARRQQTPQRHQGLNVLFDMLQHIEHADQVEGFAPERDIVRKAATAQIEAAAGLLAGDPAGDLVHLDRAHLAMRRQRRQVAPGARPGLQDPRRSRQPEASDQVIENVAPGGEPPVHGFGVGHLQVGFGVHELFASDQAVTIPEAASAGLRVDSAGLSPSGILRAQMEPDEQSMPMTDFARRERWQWWLLLLLVGLFALGIRYYYVTHAQVFQPVNQPNVRGDAVEYYRYAFNLSAHGVFSKAPAGTTPLVGDSFRDPGYPLFLAGWMKVFGQWDSWYAAVLLSQALLGALTVMLMLALARGWIGTAPDGPRQAASASRWQR